MYFHYNVTKIVECTISSEQIVSKTLISLARLRHVKYGRFWLLSGRREIGAKIRELPENTGDLATLGSTLQWDTGKFAVADISCLIFMM